MVSEKIDDFHGVKSSRSRASEFVVRCEVRAISAPSLKLMDRGWARSRGD
jgi:hypothetical protein